MNTIFRSAKNAIRRVFQKRNGVGFPDLLNVSDPRKSRGMRHSFSSILQLLLAGMLGGYSSLRGVVALGQRMGLGISYFALYTILGCLKVEDFRTSLHKQIKALHRAKSLVPEGFPCHIAAIDGKSLYYGRYKLNKYCQKTTEAHSKARRFNLRVMRTTLVSATMRPTIEQQAIPANTSEEGFFPEYFQSQLTIYGRTLLNNIIFTIDAGYSSLENATIVDNSGNAYVLALKGNQPSLMTETIRIFDNLRQKSPEFTSEWRVYKGKELRTLFYRSPDLKGWSTDAGEWKHLRQVWLVVTEQRSARGRKKRGPRKSNSIPNYTKVKVTDERYFATNILWEYLKAKQCVAVVRSHWGVENNSNWTTDVIWNEDDAPWCRKKEALLVLSLLRLMAINMVLWIKHRLIRNDRMKKWGWKEWLDWIRSMIERFIELTGVCLSIEK